jgi:ketosteroid isomerase-like protein
MRRIALFLFSLIVAFTFAACDYGTNTKPTTNTANTATATNAAAKPAAPAPTKDALLALETKAFDAWKNKDGKFFEGFLADKFLSINEKGREDRAATIKSIIDSKCEVKSFALSDEQMMPAGADVSILTFKVKSDFKCDGKPGPPEAWAATVYMRAGDQWKAAYHNEAPLIDPKAPPKAPAKPAEAAKPADAKSADALTAALTAIELKGWEAWKNKDSKGLDDITAKDFVFIDGTGRYDKSAAIKLWTEQKCEIKSVAISDAAGDSYNKDFAILTYKGSADGKCDGAPYAPVWGTTIFMKDGETWKMMFMFEIPG